MPSPVHVGELAYMRLGQHEGVQRVPLKSAASAETKVEVLQPLLASETKTEVLQPVLASDTKLEVLQAVLASETKIEVLQALPAQDVKIIDVGRQVA